MEKSSKLNDFKPQKCSNEKVTFPKLYLFFHVVCLPCLWSLSIMSGKMSQQRFTGQRGTPMEGCSKYCRQHNTPCKCPLPLATGATLLLCVSSATGKCFNVEQDSAALWQRQYLPSHPPQVHHCFWVILVPLDSTLQMILQRACESIASVLFLFILLPHTSNGTSNFLNLLKDFTCRPPSPPHTTKDSFSGVQHSSFFIPGCTVSFQVIIDAKSSESAFLDMMTCYLNALEKKNTGMRFSAFQFLPNLKFNNWLNSYWISNCRQTSVAQYTRYNCIRKERKTS